MYGSARLTLPVARPGMSHAHHGLLFAGAIGAFCLNKIIASEVGIAAHLLAIMGDGTCGWSWLLVRSLFRGPSAPPQKWPLLLVVAMVASGAALRFGDAGNATILRMAGNTESLISSALLLLAAIEPLRGIRDDLPRAERRFRIGFAASYATVLIVAVLLVNGAPANSVAGQFGGSIKVICAFVALAGMGFAIWYRSRHPVPERAGPKRRNQVASDLGLGDRILRVLQAKDVLEHADLKVAELARRVGEPEYKVTQCITGALGFRNFNRMANHFRVAEAKRRLTDPHLAHLPVLTIALDCGFGSIGPFNRAFKAETGITPTHFRKTQGSGRAA